MPMYLAYLLDRVSLYPNQAVAFAALGQAVRQIHKEIPQLASDGSTPRRPKQPVQAKQPVQRIPWRPPQWQKPEYLEIPCQLEDEGFGTERSFKLKTGHTGICDVDQCTPEPGPGFVLGQVVKRQDDAVVVYLPNGRLAMVDYADLEEANANGSTPQRPKQPKQPKQ